MLAGPPPPPQTPETDAKEAPFGMTDLEEALRGPDGAAVREEIIARLGASLDEIESRIAAGLTSSDYNAALAISRSLVTARQIMLLFR